ncbi:glycosyltransferase [Baekduia soli]|uniref:Glycosyltransferase n=1 Tax=Baekduia soli TaxID=496014 RepID=A0A5B8U015_9ACTN|nr:glycosyltransferase family 2 protein [Baekduia soli]QEC46312.1 glycosyltransferase [Baekduia soli]
MDEAVRIAFEAGLPYTALRDFRPDERLWGRIAPEWAVRERVVPLLVVGDRLQLAATRPDPDLSALHGDWAGVDVVIAPAGEIDAALAQVAAAPTREDRAPVTDPGDPHRLGDLLVAHGATTDDAVAQALGEQERTGGLIGDVLLSRGAVGEDRLRSVLAEQLGLPVIDLGGYEADPAAVALVPELLQRRLRCVPIAVDDAAVFLAVADPLDDDALTALRTALGGLQPRCFLAGRHDVDELLQDLHQETWTAAALGTLRDRFPGETCATPVRPALVLAGILVLAAAIAGLAVAPATAGLVLVALTAAACAAPALLALPLAVAAAGPRRAPVRAAGGDELPLTTLLMPLGRGAGASVRAAGTLAALDHPQARLEVLLLCPAHDVAGLRAARELTRRAPHRLVAVPSPAAASRAAMLDYGLLLARGEQIAVLDPGDVPAPGLLRTADAALRAAGRRTAVAQAALAPPPGGGAVAAWLAAEAAAWHDLLSPGLARLGLPVPLATVGLVARRAALEEIGGWDPASAAAGTDLGLRLHKSGLRATTIDAAVGVSGVTGARGWLSVHAVWWRGTLQAFKVQLRHPWRTVRRLGPGGTLAAVVLGLATIAAPLVWLPVLVLTVLGALQGLQVVDGLLPVTLARIAGGEVVVVCLVTMVLGVAGGLRRRSGAAARAALLAPVALTAGAIAAWVGIAGVVAGLGRGAAAEAG